LGNFARHGAAFGFPFVPTAIENFHLLMSKQPESPECVAGPPVGLITIKNAGRVWRDPVTTAKLRKFLRRDIITDHRVLQISTPVTMHWAGSVAGMVSETIYTCDGSLWCSVIALSTLSMRQ